MTTRPRRVRVFLTIAALLVLTPPLLGQRQAPPPQTTADRLLAAMHAVSGNTILDWVKDLTSETYQGRLTGTPTYDAAAA